MDEKREKQIKLAREILILSRNNLLVNLRFLDMALSMFSYIPVEASGLLTDGVHLLYNPRHILSCYKLEREIPVRDYLHLVLHCIFRHMYVNPNLEHTYWDIACDIAVENVISELGLKCCSASREKQQADFLNDLKKDIKQPTAEKIYSYLRQTKSDTKSIAELRGLFYADDHQCWYMQDDEIEAEFNIKLSAPPPEQGDEPNDGSNSNNPDGRENGGSPDGRENGNGESSREQSGNSSDSSGSSSRTRPFDSRKNAEAEWKEIAERMQLDMETFGKQQGCAAGGLSQNLLAVNREKYDYTAFLKKFAVLGEAMKINDDEYDYIFYTYGLQLYDKMPLIEPLEYKEVKRIKEFIIAIDTSGSTSGELVQKFVQKTYNILKSTESFFSKINIHIIQCDAEIQEDVKIENQEDFDNYLKTMKIHGLGGTDFRPVFSYVESLIKQKEFYNLKGLIYFTDGFGEFPDKKPPYDTAFVYIDDDYNNPDVPPWAIKLVLQRDEI